jgi:hypothetical protein
METPLPIQLPPSPEIVTILTLVYIVLVQVFAYLSSMYLYLSIYLRIIYLLIALPFFPYCGIHPS